MDTALQEKIIEYRKLIENPLYVVEMGSLDTTGGNRHIFGKFDDFCGVDEVRGPGVDIVAKFSDINRLFDYNPDVLICLNIFKKNKEIKRIVNGVRDCLMPNGYLIIFLPHKDEGSFVDALFSGYKVLDISIVNNTICGLAKKTLK